MSTAEVVAGAAWGASVGDWLLLAAAALLLLWVAGTWNYDYFARRGVPSTRPRLPFCGDALPGLLGLRAFPDLLLDWHARGRGHAVFGLFDMRRPQYLARDPALLKAIAVKDFEHFVNHREIVPGYSEPIITNGLFLLKDERWRTMRATLSPAFTASKMRGMLPLICECAEQMVDHLRQRCAAGAEDGLAEEDPLEVNMKDLFTRVTNDVIASVAFGLKCDSLKSPKNEFYQMGKAVTSFSALRIIIFFFYSLCPTIAGALRLRVFEPGALSFLERVVHETLAERKRRGVQRPDMLQLLQRAREGRLRADEQDEHDEQLHEAPGGAAKSELTNDEISGQAISFFFAGFETVSVALCFTTYALSHHPEIQKRLQQEIDEMMKATDGKISYDAIHGMKYLDAVVSESLRLYPPIFNLDRVCGGDTVLPACGASGPVPLKKGDVVVVSTIGLHRDPEHWPESLAFDPERFSDARRHEIKPFTYMPFGLGPRACIGQRFAIMEVKVAIVHLLGNFDIQPSPKTKHPMEFEKGFSMGVCGGFWSKLSLREEQKTL